MSIYVQVPVLVALTNEEKDVLSRVLQYKEDSDLEGALARIGRAALTEYLEMILGKQVPTRANEIYERRLFHLIKHYFEGRIPTESHVSMLFQRTQTSSRTLLRDVIAKFRFDLETELIRTVKNTLVVAEQQESGEYHVVIQCDNILEELRQTVANEAAGLDQISKVRNSICKYVIPEDTFDVLRDFYFRDKAEAAVTADE